MNNEPVAWGYKDFNGDISDCICPEEHDRAEGDYTIPLYTHPAELTDEEINKLWEESYEDGIAMQQGFTTQQHYFAYLILRKANEK